MSRSLLLLVVPIIIGLFALQTGDILFKAGVPFSCSLILLLTVGRASHGSALYSVVAAFLFSMLGDYLLSNKNGRECFFVYGIAAYFFAHIGYSWYAFRRGGLHRMALAVLLILFLPYFFLALFPAIQDTVLKLAVFLYLLISLLALALAFGIQLAALAKGLFVLGIGLIVLSDTLISFTEFLDFPSLNSLILPTYYVAHVSITSSLIVATEGLLGQDSVGAKARD